MADCCTPSRDGQLHTFSRPPRVSQGAVATLRDDFGVHQPSGMVQVAGGPFLMGTNDGIAYPIDGEGPQRTVIVDDFWIDSTAVTNAQFAAFVDATDYRTEAEAIGWSFVPAHLLNEHNSAAVIGRAAETPWWAGVSDANWRQPLGPGSSAAEIPDHPVVQVSWNDSAAFANWSGKRLPTEAEWEKAARGGLEGSTYPWGNEFMPDGVHRCNIWQGHFPDVNTGDDGYHGTAPVTAFEPNGFGLYNMSGNVWEWCSDWWSTSWHMRSQLSDRTNPLGPLTGNAKVMRGGSFMCHDSYCNRYRLSARTSNSPESSSAHMGFRCAL